MWVTKKSNLRNRDKLWNDELDARLIRFAKDRGTDPYDVIAQAVVEYLDASE